MNWRGLTLSVNNNMRKEMERFSVNIPLEIGHIWYVMKFILLKWSLRESKTCSLRQSVRSSCKHPYFAGMLQIMDKLGDLMVTSEHDTWLQMWWKSSHPPCSWILVKYKLSSTKWSYKNIKILYLNYPKRELLGKMETPENNLPTIGFIIQLL